MAERSGSSGEGARVDRRALFLQALRDVNPAFDLYCRAANVAAGSDARGFFYEHSTIEDGLAVMEMPGNEAPGACQG